MITLTMPVIAEQGDLVSVQADILANNPNPSPELLSSVIKSTSMTVPEFTTLDTCLLNLCNEKGTCTDLAAGGSECDCDSGFQPPSCIPEAQ